MYADPENPPCVDQARTSREPAAPAQRDRAERHAVDILVRYAWRGLRGTVLLRDLTASGARIEGLEALRRGDGLTLLLPEMPAVDATVAWAMDRAAGLRFDIPLDAAMLARLLSDFGHRATTPAPRVYAARLI